MLITLRIFPHHHPYNYILPRFSQKSIGSGAENRTQGLEVMSFASYHCSTPQGPESQIRTDLFPVMSRAHNHYAISGWWMVTDSNRRSPKATVLQTACFIHLHNHPWCPRRDSNPHPTRCRLAAPPLSYAGITSSPCR